jgi:hypothetical protein
MGLSVLDERCKIMWSRRIVVPRRGLGMLYHDAAQPLTSTLLTVIENSCTASSEERLFESLAM